MQIDKARPPHFVISCPPHIRQSVTTGQIMWGVVLALIPVTLASIYFFRWHAIGLIITCVLTGLLTEIVFQRVRKKRIALGDGSAVVTGLLLALTLPPNLPLWTAILGAVVAIGLGKQVFGGLGHNIFNPALVGRAFLMAAFPAYLTTWINPVTLDAISRATPLGLMKFEGASTPWVRLFLGYVSGSLGETSTLAILLGGIYLISRRLADWRVPVAILMTVIILGGLAHRLNPARFPSVTFHLFSGGLMLGAVFMATDPVTSPITKGGRWLFGSGVGTIIVLIRLWGALPEGTMYSILLMNSVTPLINRFTVPKRFGLRRA